MLEAMSAGRHWVGRRARAMTALRLAISIWAGTATASLRLSKLASSPWQSRLALTSQPFQQG
ncbi:hypothetical protein [Deinococcus aetherius]|uniref:hypothetical protein n=1 Tax=Deinococcus aetherius TaxID=200252 RepID=UPI0022307A1C|nr:hypothetical protein [Deinococcus aetherius]